MKDYCKAIADLWLQLNPHCTVQGCHIDDAGTVRLGLWYSRDKKMQPLELVLGNPPSQVLKTLRNAISSEARARRLSSVTGSRVISEASSGRISESGEVNGTDK